MFDFLRKKKKTEASASQEAGSQPKLQWPAAKETQGTKSESDDTSNDVMEHAFGQSAFQRILQNVPVPKQEEPDQGTIRHLRQEEQDRVFNEESARETADKRKPSSFLERFWAQPEKMDNLSETELPHWPKARTETHKRGHGKEERGINIDR